MMKDNKIAELLLVAGIKVHEEIENAEYVETCADGDPCSRSAEIDVKRIHEGDMEKPHKRHEHHERVPVKSTLG